MPSINNENLNSIKSQKFIYLTTVGRKSGKLYTKELWFAIGDGKIFLSHEGDSTDWMKNIAKKSKVQAKIGLVNFEANGKILGKEDKAQRELGMKSLYEKYYGPASKEVIDDWFELSTVIELTPLS
jgi:deazaflavin-dependent oxidoreductase (nitroreductase family)